MIFRHLKKLTAVVVGTDSAFISQGMAVTLQHRAVCFVKGVICSLNLNVLWFLLESQQV